MIISAFEAQTEDDLKLSEIILDEDHHWLNTYLRNIKIAHGLIVLIQRDNQIIVPHGDVLLLNGDMIVIAHSSKGHRLDKMILDIE